MAWRHLANPTPSAGLATDLEKKRTADVALAA
jgi:hypothetical protein